MDKFPKKRSEFRIWIDQRNKEVQNYFANRKLNYPEIGEQLDAIWHDIDDGILPGKEGKFYKLLEANKKRYKSPDWNVEEFVAYDFSKETFIEDLD